jgi:DNA polymerase-3 subunit delta
MPLLNSIETILSGDFPPVLLIFGEERFLLDDAFDKLISKLIPDEQARFDYEKLDGNETDFSSVVDACLSYPFVSPKRVVVISNFESLAGKPSAKENIHLGFDKYLDNPQPTTCLILKADISSLNGISYELKNSRRKVKAEKKLKGLKFPYGKLFEKYNCIEYPKFRESAYHNWVAKRFEMLNRKVEHDVIELLLAQTNSDLREIDQEIRKVVSMVSKEEKIKTEDVARSLGTSHIYNVFELQKAVGRRNLLHSIEIMQKMLENDRQEVLIVTILSRFFTTLWKLDEVIRSNNNQYVIAGAVGINPYFVSEYSDSLKRYKPGEINQAIKMLTVIDEKLKSSSMPPKYLLEEFFVKIINK